MTKWIVRIGFVLTGIVILSWLGVIVVSMIEGTGGLISTHKAAGKPSFFAPAAMLPVLLIIGVLGVVAFFKRRSKRGGSRSEKPESERNSPEQRASPPRTK
jgi:hypothetical protein